MHEFFVNIGYAILNFFRNVKTDNILKSLSIMGIGMVGIFWLRVLSCLRYIS